MRYYLDTQTLAQLLFNADAMSKNVRMLFEEYENSFLTSVVCVKELIHLIQTNRIHPASRKRRYSAQETLITITSIGVEIRQVDTLHLEQLACLPIYDSHNDPNDRLIIAQAIRDRIPIISSDTKFSIYKADGLDLIPNHQ